MSEPFHDDWRDDVPQLTIGLDAIKDRFAEGYYLNGATDMEWQRAMGNDVAWLLARVDELECKVAGGHFEDGLSDAGYDQCRCGHVLLEGEVAGVHDE